MMAPGVHTQEPNLPRPQPEVEVLLAKATRGFRMYDLDKAQAALDRAIKLNDLPGQGESWKALAWANANEGRTESALNAWDQAANAWRNVSHGPRAAEALVSRAFFVPAGSAQAMRYVEDAVSAVDSDSMRPLEGAYYLAIMSNDMRVGGHTREAAYLANQALLRFEAKAATPHHLAYCYANVGDQAFLEGDSQRAEIFYQKAVEELQARSPNSPNIAYGYSSLMQVELRRGNLQAALAHANNALAFVKGRSLPEFIPADMQLGKAQVEGRLGNREISDEWLRRALAYWESREPTEPLGQCYFLLGINSEGDDEFALAKSWFVKAIEVQRKVQPSSIPLSRSLEELARIYLRANDPIAAEKAANEALSILEQQRGFIGGSDQARAIFQEAATERISSPALLIDAQLRQGKTVEALGSVERFRARTLSELIYEKGLRLVPQEELPKALVAKQIALNLRIKSLYRALEGSANPQGVRSLIVKARAEQRQIESQFRSSSPRYGMMKYPRPLDGTAVRAALDPGTLLLTYAFIGQKAWLFIVTKSKVRAHLLPRSRREIEASAVSYLASLTSRGKVLREGTALYKLLVAPAAPEIAHSKRLLICPQGQLAFVPFASLVVESASSTGAREDLKGAKFLVEGMPIHQTASMTALVEGRNLAKEKLGRDIEVLSIGGASYSDPTPSRDRKLGKSLASLESLASGVKAIGRGPKSMSFVGKSATKEKLEMYGSKAKVLHLAVHGQAYAFDPLGSWLAFAPSKTSDGLFTASDLLSSQLRADLVVMCACQTATGRQTQTEGIDGLTRAALAAGAKSVVSSLWSVNANTSDALMRDFYGQRQKGRSTDAALQGAALTVKKKQAHPYYWAPFVLSGDWR